MLGVLWHLEQRAIVGALSDDPSSEEIESLDKSESSLTSRTFCNGCGPGRMGACAACVWSWKNREESTLGRGDAMESDCGDDMLIFEYKVCLGVSASSV